MKSSWIVLGEPDVISRAAIEANLHALGFQVDVCETFDRVLEAMARCDVICVLADKLPGGEGALGISAVRALSESTPLIMLVQELEPDLVFDAYLHGADLVLCKPVQLGEWRSLFGFA